MIPQAAIDGLLRLGFEFEEGELALSTPNYGRINKRYQMINREREIYLMVSYRSAWFYHLPLGRWIHPDQIHDIIEREGI